VYPQSFPWAPTSRLASPDAHAPLLALVSYEAMTNHVLTCIPGHTYNLIEPVTRLQANGGSVVREPIDHSYGRLSTVADDQGAVISLLGVAPG
jgi:hypothetical protein